MKTIIEPEKLIQVDHSLIFDEYQKALTHIRMELRDVARYCERKSNSIEKDNMLFMFALEKAKREAFSQIKFLIKPYVIYLINKYYLEYYKTN